jgi:flagellar basal body-associated protein FliL
MARAVATETAVATRSGANLAIAISIIALIIALACLIFTIGARRIANDAQKTASSTKVYTQDTVKKALNEANKAAPGNSAGPNNPQPAAGSTLPNGNGQ